VHLARSGLVVKTDLAHRKHFAFAWPVSDVEFNLGVGEFPGVGAAVLIDC